MSNPREKAIELYNKMYFAEDQDGFHSMNKYRPKQCALIAVDLAIEYNDFHIEFLQELKREIEKL
jgi:ethanolamine utilization microcompartment shell protein EutS